MIRLSSSRRVRSIAYAVVIAVAVTACGRGDGSVTIRGVDELRAHPTQFDSILGQSPVANAHQDSLRAIIALRQQGTALPSSASASTANTLSSATPNSASAAPNATDANAARGKAMTERAKARGDSIARADARHIGDVDAELARRSKGDTVRGVVALTGAAAAPQLVIKQSGRADIALSGMATTGMSRLAGAEVVVRGFMVSPRDVVVSDYIVRAMNGVPTYDGVLTESSGGWELALTDGSGRKRLPIVPATLRTAVGVRVWVSTKISKDGPDGFGLIKRK